MINGSYNKRYKIIRHLTASLFMAMAILASCSGDMNFGMKGNATVKITMKVPQQKNISTRTSNLTGNESKVNDLTVLIFNSDNQLIGEGYVSAPSAANDTYQLSVNTRKADMCTIYAVANAGENAFTSGDGSNTVKGVGHPINTVDDFKKACSELSSTSDIGSQSGALMEGVLNNENIGAGNTTLTDIVPLYRLCTMMNFDIKPASDIRITGYQLHEVPMSSYITDRTKETSPLYNPNNKFDNFSAVTLPTPTAGAEVKDTYYIYENLAGTKNQAVDARTRNTYAPGTASYIDIYAVGPHWKSTYRVYLGGTGTTDYGNYNILRNYNYTYTISILSSGVYDVRVTCYPELINNASATSWGSNGDAGNVSTAKVGDFYFSDGSWGKLADHATSTVYPIGVIFSNTPTDNDKAHGWAHGYAMALTNANTSCVWSLANSSNSSYLDETGDTYSDSHESFSYSNYQDSYADLEKYKDGYSETQAIKSSGKLGYNQTEYPAFWYALNYGTTNESTTTNYATPTNNANSGWYLPSIGQWCDIFANLGKITSTPTSAPGWSYWSGNASACASNINNILSAISSYTNHGYDSFYMNNSNELYWSSSENGSNAAGSVVFYATGELGLNYSFPKYEYYMVRAVVAF